MADTTGFTPNAGAATPLTAVGLARRVLAALGESGRRRLEATAPPPRPVDDAALARQLRMALERFGQHRAGCPASATDPTACRCGLTHALATLRPGGPLDQPPERPGIVEYYRRRGEGRR
jgi:hypothetical protein